MSKYHGDHDILHSSEVHIFIFEEFTFDMDLLCIVCDHAYLMLSMGILASGRYCIFGKFLVWLAGGSATPMLMN